MKLINVIGLGYIGLPTALMMAASGNKIIGTDIQAEIVEKLKVGTIPFEEKGIEELYKEALKNDIEFSTDYQKTDMYIVTVPTPYIKETKRIKPDYIISAVESIIEVCNEKAIIVIESTVSPGTIDKFIRPIFERKNIVLGDDIHLVHAPERILPGNMVYELRHNARTIGADNYDIGNKVKKIYETFCEEEIVVTDIKTAEMTKVIENTFRDINIAFANELAQICDFDGMDVYEIIRIANKHPRVNILTPGPGVGGHCISVDPWFLVGDYPEHTNIIKQARYINDAMPEYVLKRIREIATENNIQDLSRIGLYGLSYKPNVDDTRESPTLQLLESMKRHLAEPLKVYDPMINKNIVENQYFDFDEFLNDIDLIVIMVGHKHIIEHSHNIQNKVIYDTQNIIQTEYKL